MVSREAEMYTNSMWCFKAFLSDRFLNYVTVRCNEQEQEELKIFLSLAQNCDVTQNCFAKMGDRSRDDKYSFDDRMIICLFNSTNTA